MLPFDPSELYADWKRPTQIEEDPLCHSCHDSDDQPSHGGRRVHPRLGQHPDLRTLAVELGEAPLRRRWSRRYRPHRYEAVVRDVVPTATVTEIAAGLHSFVIDLMPDGLMQTHLATGRSPMPKALSTSAISPRRSARRRVAISIPRVPSPTTAKNGLRCRAYVTHW
jgi:hypothetical protein